MLGILMHPRYIVDFGDMNLCRLHVCLITLSLVFFLFLASCNLLPYSLACFSFFVCYPFIFSFENRPVVLLN